MLHKIDRFEPEPEIELDEDEKIYVERFGDLLRHLNLHVADCIINNDLEALAILQTVFAGIFEHGAKKIGELHHDKAKRKA